MHLSRRYRSRGVALIVVLAFITLLTIFIVAFFSMTQTDLRMSKSYDDGVAVRELVNAATQVAVGQITDGTKSVKIPSAPTTGAPPTIAPGSRLAWASQPGAIRTWDDTGAGWKLFKLYSAKDMVLDLDSKGYSTSAHLSEEIPPTWPAQGALYTDLNEPVLSLDTAGGITRNGQKYRATYPILDALALTQVKGFSITNPPGYGGPVTSGQPSINTAYDPTVAPAPDKTGNPAPMPVAWMYVLKDGTLTVPTGSPDGGRTASWDGADARYTPSQANPIVGRFAFWGDDETCKVNINTASEPTPWDTPRAVNLNDLGYGRYQPAQKEYQRFPGHPYTTALSPVLSPNLTDPAAILAMKTALYGVLPRVQQGGTYSGTIAVENLTLSPVVLDNDRLFANVDEFLFQPTRTDNPVVSPEVLKRSRFFLTANSRAPELNLFGQPRVSLWPVDATDSTAKRTAYDRLAIFCATLGDPTATLRFPFYFQRGNSTSPTLDYTSIQRNQDVYKYLQALTKLNEPGFGGSFSSKWNADATHNDCDQVLTEIFDYIRCTNLRDPLLVKAGATPFAPYGWVAPIHIGNTQGFGRFPTLSQFAMHFICSQDGNNGVLNGGKPPNDKIDTGKRMIEAALLMEPFCPSQGYAELKEQMSYEVTFQTPFQVNGLDLKFPTTKVTLVSNDVTSSGFGDTWHGRYWGGSYGCRGSIHTFGGASYPLVSKASPRVTVSAAASPTGPATMTFSGGTVQVKIYAGTAASAANLLQTMTLTFPPTSLPVPELVVDRGTPLYPGGTTAYRGAAATTASQWWTLASRYASVNAADHVPGLEYADPLRRFGKDNTNVNTPGFKPGSVFRPEDVVRSLVPIHGDIRLVAARDTVGPETFGKGYYYDDLSSPNGRLDHIFAAMSSHGHYGFANEPGLTSPPGSQLTPANYHYSTLPEIKAGAGKQYNLWNDFDNGMAQVADGAYINKPDEGNVAHSSGTVNGDKYNYFAWNYTEPSDSFFSPNRLVPSAGMLGSLPTGVKRNRPWETLLFRPELNVDKSNLPHPGTKTPKDHLLMDLFWMPVIEPYAISEPFSTAGKINMNYEIAPFSYIRRATGLHGVMKSEEPLAVPNNMSKVYKLWDHETSDWPWLPDDPDPRACLDPQVKADWITAATGKVKMRLPIDADATLTQFDDTFAKGELFRSATQICEMHLVRQGETLDQYRNNKFWPNYLVTGDNSRERPYTNLYARLTTKSNTFSIHVRAQVLRKVPTSNPDDWKIWREGKDQQVSEYRGSTIVERYIDPSDPTLTDFAKNTNAVADTAYKMRVVNTKKFTP